MGSEEAKDPLKGWDNMSSATNATNSKVQSDQSVTKKRFPKKVRQIPEYYFLPRMSWPKAIAYYGSFIVAGVGAGMLLEVWIKKKIEEDGGIIWEFEKDK